MRNGSHRFWLCIAAAVAVSAIAVPAASAGVPKYDTKLTIWKEAGRLYHGDVKSEVGKCERGRQVTLFKKRPGADRRVGTVLSSRHGTNGDDLLTGGKWAIRALGLQPGDRAYAKVTPKVRDRFVCRADRSKTLTWPEEAS
jgi:hypothetical protein